MSGLAGGSSLKSEADFNLRPCDHWGKKKKTMQLGGVDFRGATPADEVINAQVLVWQKGGLSLTHKFFPGPDPREQAFYLSGLSTEIKCHFL